MKSFYLFEVVTVVVVVFLVGWTAYGFFFEGEIESPSYKVLQKEGGIELREYDPFIIAETVVDAPYDSAINAGFRRLANFIFGNNQSNSKIAMTAPVIHHQEMSQSSPLGFVDVTDTGTHRVSFVMPLSMEMGQIPRPNRDGIELRTVEWGKVVVIRYSGYSSFDTVKEKSEQLKAYIKESNLEAVSPAMVAQYNSPWVMPLLRRNEVLVRVK